MKKIALFWAGLLSLCLLGACMPARPASPDGDTTPSPSPSASAKPEETKAEGWYTLVRKTVDGKDVTSGYLINAIYLKNGTADWYEVDYSGKNVRNAAYTAGPAGVDVTVGVKVYDFAYDKENATLLYEGKVNKQEVSMLYAYDAGFSLSEETGGVSFTDELFGESKDENFYNYCPTIMMEGNDTMHIWYCSNRDSGKVTDYVAYRKGTLNTGGKWEFSEKQLVLAPTPGTWDLAHTCDPSVIRGDFGYGGKKYSYLMAYLGCATFDNSVNEVGIAVAEKPEGPWVKVEELNPIANFKTSPDFNASSWGFGQPCLISSDNAGKVILFYTKGVTSGTHVYAEEWDFSDIDHARKVREGRLWDTGVTNAGGQTDVINNADLAYDPYLKRLYCIKEDFPYPTDGGVNWIAGSNTLMYMDLGASGGFDAIFSEHRWNVCGKITRETTGFLRNHNCGIITDAYGRLIDPFRVPIVYTMSEAAESYPNWPLGGQWPALHTYRLHGYVFGVR